MARTFNRTFDLLKTLITIQLKMHNETTKKFHHQLLSLARIESRMKENHGEVFKGDKKKGCQPPEMHYAFRYNSSSPHGRLQT